MANPFLGEVKIVAFNFAPKGWAQCNGQLLPLNQNQALFSILGTSYGGDGRTTFGLPNLQGRSPLHVGQGLILGQVGGETTHTINMSEMVAHTHIPVGNTSVPSSPTASGNVWASNASAFDTAANATMNPASILPAGGSQPHENMSPFLALIFIIALQGIFPSRN